MKKYCKTCSHRCHCMGSGYHINTNKCDNCICDNCNCSDIITLTNQHEGNMLKKIWKKIVDWLWK
jgi:hypothetical protein